MFISRLTYQVEIVIYVLHITMFIFMSNYKNLKVIYQRLKKYFLISEMNNLAVEHLGNAIYNLVTINKMH